MSFVSGSATDPETLEHMHPVFMPVSLIVLGRRKFGESVIFISTKHCPFPSKAQEHLEA